MDTYYQFYDAVKAERALELMAQARNLYNDLSRYRDSLLETADIDHANEADAAVIAARDALNDIITDRR